MMVARIYSSLRISCWGVMMGTTFRYSWVLRALMSKRPKPVPGVRCLALMLCRALGLGRLDCYLSHKLLLLAPYGRAPLRCNNIKTLTIFKQR